MKRTKHAKGIIGAAVLAGVIAVIFAGAMIVERIQQGEREKELQAERELTRPSIWTAENTVTLDGETYGYDHRIESYLFIGTDLSGNPDPNDYRGAMADFLLLMVLDHTDDTISYLQIDRNTITEVRELDQDGDEITSRKIQICTAHWYGRTPEAAAENTADAVSRYLGNLKIDGYYVMSMRDIGKLNSTVGGVEVTVEDDLDLDDPALQKGQTVQLNDAQAERFLRARMNIGEGTNAERMARQRQYMSGFFRKVREKTTEDPEFGLALWEMLRDAAVTDMKGNDFSRIAQKMIKGTDKGIRVLRGETRKGYVLGDGIEHEEFYPDQEDKKAGMTELYSLVRISDEV